MSDDAIMHDRMNCLFDSLVGMPPLYCATAPALSSIAMQEFSSRFFVNAARPSGVLSAPGEITPEQIARLKSQMEQGYSEQNRGRVAVMGNGLKFEIDAAECRRQSTDRTIEAHRRIDLRGVWYPGLHGRRERSSQL